MTGQRFDTRLLDNISLRPVETVTTADHEAGATTLLVEVAGDLEDWDPESQEPLEQVRGYVQIVPPEAPDADPIPPFVMAYYDWDGELEEQEYVLLAAGLPVGVPAESQVRVWSPDLAADPSGAVGEIVADWVGQVMADDDDLNAEPVEVEILPDLVDTLTAVDVASMGGVPVVVETLESYYGLEKAQQLDVAGDDDLYVTTILGGDLERDGTKTPLLVQTAEVAVVAGSQAVSAATAAASAQVTANSAEERGTGAKESTPQTATTGPRVRMRQMGGRGLLEFIGETMTAVISAVVEEARQTLIVSTGGNNPTRIRMRNDTDGRDIDLLCDEVNAYGRLNAAQGLSLPLSPGVLRGVDGNSAVERVTSSDGTVTIPHNVSGAGIVLDPSPRPGSSESLASTDYFMVKGPVTGSEVTFRARWNANNSAGEPPNTPVVNRRITFDWFIGALDR